MFLLNAILPVGIAFAVVGLCMGVSQNTKFTTCKSGSSKIEYVNISPCSKFPCPLAPNKKYNVTIKFTANEAVSAGHVMLKAELAHLWLPYPGFEYTKMCDRLLGGASCPLKAGQTVLYNTPLSIPKGTPVAFLPDVLPISWTVKDKSGKNVLCFVTEASITK